MAHLFGFWVQARIFFIVHPIKFVLPFHFLTWPLNACNNFCPLPKLPFFFGLFALGESFHSSSSLCVGMVARENYVLVSSYSSFVHLLITTICCSSFMKTFASDCLWTFSSFCQGWTPYYVYNIVENMNIVEKLDSCIIVDPKTFVSTMHLIEIQYSAKDFIHVS